MSQHIIDDKVSTNVLKDSWEKIIMLITPMIPHLANECREKINKDFYWPEFNLNLLKEENCKIVIQVDGRKRGIFEMPINTDENLVIKNAKKIDNVSKYIGKSTVIKNIYLKNKLVNFITKK